MDYQVKDISSRPSRDGELAEIGERLKPAPLSQVGRHERPQRRHGCHPEHRRTISEGEHDTCSERHHYRGTLEEAVVDLNRIELEHDECDGKEEPAIRLGKAPVERGHHKHSYARGCVTSR